MAAKKKAEVRMSKDDRSIVRTVGRENAKIRKGWAELLGTQMKHDEQLAKLLEDNKELKAKMKKILTDPMVAEPMKFSKRMDELEEKFKELKFKLTGKAELERLQRCEDALASVRSDVEKTLTTHGDELESHEARLTDVENQLTEPSDPAPSPDNLVITKNERVPAQVDLEEAVAYVSTGAGVSPCVTCGRAYDHAVHA